MSKSAKKSASAQSKPGEQAEASEAAAPAASPGQLIALDGASGPDLRDASRRVVKMFEKHEVGVSGFDSSNTFFELRAAKGKVGGVPPETLILLYASDLLFRIRWEIRPALAEGRTVVAAPYVHTVIAMGLAAGLSRVWLEELFTFAPPADVSFRLKEKSKGNGKEIKGSKGYCEFCCKSLALISPRWNAADLRRDILKQLAAFEEEGKLVALGKKLPKKMLRKAKS